MLLKTINILFLLLLFKTYICLPVSEDGSDFDSWNELNPQNPEELGNYFEGDIIPIRGRNGLVGEKRRWNNGIIPFEIKGDFPTKDKNMILKAINMYNKYTCVSFRPKTPEDKNYISITNYKSGCWSKVGKSKTKQEVNLQSPQCTTRLGTPLHELMHAAGFLHEQNRNERDSYVTINWNNIIKGKELNFDKAKEGIEHGYGVTYDFDSVMHYSSMAFSSNGEHTIVPKDMDKIKNMGQRRGFSPGDIIKINSMYNCPEKTQTLNLTAENTDWDKNIIENKKESNSFWNTLHNLFTIFDQK